VADPRPAPARALARWPGALRVDGSGELREVPETQADRQAVATSSWVRIAGEIIKKGVEPPDRA